jgi:hypothetical protein
MMRKITFLGILLFWSAFLCGPLSAQPVGIFGDLNNLQINGKISAHNYRDRILSLSVNGGVLVGTVSAKDYNARNIRLVFTPTSITGSYSSPDTKERKVDFAIAGSSIQGSILASGYEPRLLTLAADGTNMQGTRRTQGYSDRRIDLSIQGLNVNGTITARDFSPRVILLYASDNTLQGTVSEENSVDRKIDLTFSRIDPQAIRLLLFLFLLDTQVQQAFLGAYSVLNLNTNLNLP